MFWGEEGQRANLPVFLLNQSFLLYCFVVLKGVVPVGWES